jgi:hypothetical protein
MGRLLSPALSIDRGVESVKEPPPLRSSWITGARRDRRVPTRKILIWKEEKQACPANRGVRNQPLFFLGFLAPVLRPGPLFASGGLVAEDDARLVGEAHAALGAVLFPQRLQERRVPLAVEPFDNGREVEHVAQLF